MAIATITEAEPKHRMGKAGKLNVNIDYLKLSSGEKVALRAVKETKGGSNTGKMTGAIVATSILFFPAAPLFLFVKGKDVVIPKGTEITAYTNGNFTLDKTKFQPKNAVELATQAVGAKLKLSNADIMAMKKAGFSDEILIAKIKSSEVHFELSTEEMLKLKASGISEKVIEAMLMQFAK